MVRHGRLRGSRPRDLWQCRRRNGARARYGTIDTAIEKSFQFSESRRLQFRTEIINTFNSPIFNGGERNVTSTRFGEITSAQGSRRIQFGLRYEF